MLLAVERYLRRTKLPPTLLGKYALNDTTLVDKMRLGRQLQERTAAKLQAFMDRWPDGPPTPAPGVIRRPLFRKQPRDRVMPEPTALPPRVDRTPCPSCGVRGDIGCEHGRAGVNW